MGRSKVYIKLYNNRKPISFRFYVREGGYNMKKKLVFVGVGLFLIAATTLTFAHNSLAATVSITAASGDPAIVQSVGGAGSDGVPNTVQLEYSTGSSAPFTQVSPSWTPVKNQTGAITPGDVYYINATNYAGDVRVTVYLTNAGLLAKDYTYLNMMVNVWAGSSGTWTQATPVGDTANATDYLTFDKGTVSFILQGGTHYCISIDGGDYYCSDTAVDSAHDVSPHYYINAAPF